MNYQPTDVNHRLAYSAHQGTSFSPEKRADQVEELGVALAKADERVRELEKELKTLRRRMAKSNKRSRIEEVEG